MINIPVSYGELFDKISILQIKLLKIKSDNVSKELELLLEKSKNIDVDPTLVHKLKTVNKILWDIEDRLRIKEKEKEFDDEFIELARNVYFTNDKRAALKKQINVELNSVIVEEKQYVEYQ
jgi:hypothetical protein